MKKIFLSLAIILNCTIAALAQQPDEVIGVVEDETFKITSPLEELKLKWINQLTASGVSSPLKNVEILSGIDKALDDEKYYYLMGTTEDKITKIAILLKLQNGKFYLLQDEGDSPLGTIICTGCDHGCNPKKEKLWYCGGGCGLDCKKTVTVQTSD